LFKKRSTQLLGRVDAPDRAAAKIAATEKFNLTEEQRRRLVVQEGGRRLTIPPKIVVRFPAGTALDARPDGAPASASAGSPKVRQGYPFTAERPGARIVWVVLELF
jgi:hypothetical protein